MTGSENNRYYEPWPRQPGQASTPTLALSPENMHSMLRIMDIMSLGLGSLAKLRVRCWPCRLKTCIRWMAGSENYGHYEPWPRHPRQASAPMPVSLGTCTAFNDNLIHFEISPNDKCQPVARSSPKDAFPRLLLLPAFPAQLRQASAGSALGTLPKDPPRSPGRSAPRHFSVPLSSPPWPSLPGPLRSPPPLAPPRSRRLFSSLFFSSARPFCFARLGLLQPFLGGLLLLSPCLLRSLSLAPP